MRGYMVSQEYFFLEKVKDKRLLEILKGFFKGERLGFQEALYLFQTDDIFGLGEGARAFSERLHGKRVFYVKNRHINPTNICINRCRFCAYWRSPGDGYVMDLEEVEKLAERVCPLGVREFHIVGGLNPDLSFDYYLGVVERVKKACPQAVVKAYTAVEVEFFSRISGLSVEKVLEELKVRGDQVLPGGGAEVFSKRIREELCPRKISSEKWLEIHELAHHTGYRSNATMLYGHMETPEERVEHLMKLRELQDRTGGFFCFIPLRYHYKKGKTYPKPANPPTGLDDLRMIAASRLILDNFPHIKAYWVMLGEGITQLSLLFGASDMDGTVMEERITHEAGGKTPMHLPEDRIIYLIKEAGRIPVERDGLYRVVREVA